MKPTLPVSRALRTMLVLSLAAGLAMACAETSPTGGGGDGGAVATDTGSTGTDGTATDTGAAGTDTGAAGTDTGGGGGTAKVMTVKELLQAAQAVQGKVKTCPAFANPPALSKVSVKGLVAVTPVYKAGTTLDGLFVQVKGGGAFSGLRLVGDKASKLFEGVTVGTGFDIEGQVVIFYCEVQIQITKLTKSADAAVLPQATTVTLADIGEAGTADSNNSYEAALVTLNDVVISKTEALGTDGKPHGDLWIGKAKGDEGLIVRTNFEFPTTFYTYDKDTKKWTTKLVEGQKLKSISGVLTYSYEHWKLQPLSDAMLVWDSSK